MRVVIDTNVLVSGLLSPYGAAAKIIGMVVAGSLDLLYDARIMSEYQEVLSRPKFSFEKSNVGILMDFMRHYGIPVAAAPLSGHLPDIDDEPFLEVAISGKAECLVTGNIVHYPTRFRRKMRILTPRQFINAMEKIIDRIEDLELGRIAKDRKKGSKASDYISIEKAYGLTKW